MTRELHICELQRGGIELVDTERLKELIKNRGMTIEMLSEHIGMDKSTFYRKLSAEGNTFTIAQVDAIKTALALDKTTTQRIFFR